MNVSQLSIVAAATNAMNGDKVKIQCAQLKSMRVSTVFCTVDTTRFCHFPRAAHDFSHCACAGPWDSLCRPFKEFTQQ